MVRIYRIFPLLCLAAHLHATEIVAHRGSSARAPENTVSSFNLAWQEGTDACELDLYLTADGKIAVLHDKDTKRTTGTPGLVAQITLDAIQKLDAGRWKNPKYEGERIPSLGEALATLPNTPGKRFFLEIKSGPEVVPELAKQLQAWKPRAMQLCIIAFDRKVAQEAKKALPWLKVYRLSSEKTRDKQPVDLGALIRDTKADGLDGLDLSLQCPWTEELVKAAKSAGLELYVWTVDAPVDIKRLADLGVDGITTNDPVAARRALQ
jgi:glycerophosphoryl diester phosphodiesterase